MHEADASLYSLVVVMQITGHTLVLDGGQTCGDGRKLNAWPITSAATTTVEK